MKEILIKEAKNGYIVQFGNDYYVEKSMIKIGSLITRLMTNKHWSKYIKKAERDSKKEDDKGT